MVLIAAIAFILNYYSPTFIQQETPQVNIQCLQCPPS